MRFRSFNDEVIPRDLWFRLAEAMHLAGDLPEARPKDVDFICYGNQRRLRVSILKRSQRRRRDNDPIFGDYTYGYIRLMPCPHCTYAFMTRTYLHELFHAWVHQY